MTDKLAFKDRLQQQTILSDGAMGTLLHSRGVSIDSCFDNLNLSDPALIFDVHRSYIEAGAEIIETNTFGANRFKLADHGLDDRIAEINQRGVELARQAIDSSFKANLYIAGSVGPLGVKLAPFGRVSEQQAYDAFHEQTAALIEAGVDLLIIETFSDLVEIRQAVQAARDLSTDIPIIAEMTFTRDDRTLLGDSPVQVAQALDELDVDVIGANCSNGPSQITRIIRAMHQAVPDRYFSAVPNAGWPEYVGGRVMYGAQPEYFGDYAVALRDLGISVVGGCCGTMPEHIAAMRTALDDPDYTGEFVSGDYSFQDEEHEFEAAPPGELARKLARGDLVIAVEMSPPKGIATEKVLRAAALLVEAGADVIDVLDNPMARMRMSPWAICHLIEREVGVETVLHFPTRGRNLLRVQGDLLAAHAIGVRNLFVVMGDPTNIGDYPDAADNYDIVPSGLVRLVKQSLNAGRDWAGNVIGQPTNFLVSCALNVCASDMDREIRVLQKKLAGGADYLLTQPVFDPEAVDRFTAYYEEQYGPLKTPILIGLMPLYGVRHATFLNNEIPGINIPDSIMQRLSAAGDDAPREGVRIAQKIALQLKDKVAGFYLMPQFRRYDLAAEVIEAIRVAD